MKEKIKMIITDKRAKIAIVSIIIIFFTLIGNWIINFFVSLPRAVGKKAYLSIEEVASLKNLFNFSHFVKYPLVYIVFLLLGVFAGFKILYDINKSHGKINKHIKSPSELIDKKEVILQDKEIPLIKEEFEGYGGLPVACINNKVYIDNDTTNTLVQGMTRSGKGEIFVFPMIDNLSRGKEKSSLIITDPKLELCTASYETLKARGYDVYIFNMIDTQDSMSYNPLSAIWQIYHERGLEIAEEKINLLGYILIPKTVGDGSYWDDCARSIFNSVVSAQLNYCVDEKCEKEFNMHSVLLLYMKLKVQWISNKYNLLDYYMDMQDDYIQLKYSSIRDNDTKPKNSMYSTFEEHMSVFMFRSVSKLTTKNSLNLKELGFGNKPVALFLGMAENDPSKNKLISAFISQIYDVNSVQAIRDGGQCKRRITFILDEFGNIPPIPNMEQLLTVCLGKNIVFHMFVQDYSQLEKVYNKSIKTIVGNCGNQVFLKSTEPSTIERFSKMVGKSFFSKYSRSGKGLIFGEKTISESDDERYLVSEDFLKNLLRFECVIVRSMKTINNMGADIKPKTIVATKQNKMRLQPRHNYLLDYFPENILFSSLADKETRDLKDFNNEAYLTDYSVIIEKIKNYLFEKNKTEKNASEKDSYQEKEEAEKDENKLNEKRTLISDLPQCEYICNLLKPIIGVSLDRSISLYELREIVKQCGAGEKTSAYVNNIIDNYKEKAREI